MNWRLHQHRSNQFKATGNLPEELLMEILLRLPIRQLLRCRCVSKTWRDLIKTSSFVDAHMALQLARGNQPIVVCYYNEPGTLQLVSCYQYDFDSLSFIKTQPDINIPLSTYPGNAFSAHCNGIICISCYTTNTLVNPALGVVKALPPMPSHIPKDFTQGIMATGFGFDDAKMDYKVVRVHGTRVPIFDYSKSVSWEACIYNLRSNSWRNLGAKLPLSSEDSFHANVSIFCKGFLHWIIRGKQRLAILTFNMTTELLHEMTLPPLSSMELLTLPPLSSMQLYVRMFVFQNSTIACASRNHHPYAWCSSNEVINMEIWVMKEYGVAESWTKLCSISDQQSLSWPITCWENDKILFQRNTGDFSFYHLPTGQVDTFQRPKGSTFELPFGFHVCNLSFASINQPEEEEM